MSTTKKLIPKAQRYVLVVLHEKPDFVQYRWGRLFGTESEAHRVATAYYSRVYGRRVAIIDRQTDSLSIVEWRFHYQPSIDDLPSNQTIPPIYRSVIDKWAGGTAWRGS